MRKLLLSLVMLAPLSVFAAVPAGVTTALNDASADVTTIGGVILLVVVAAAVISFLRRVIH
ncbi:MAG: phage coat protein [Bacteroidales bacterium]|nr:phage coat protein [Bacteroidales bacterium]